MTMLPARTEIAPEFTWNATSVFESPEAWSAELGRLSDELQELSAFQGKLDSAARLADWFDRVATLAERVGHVFVYAIMSQSVDTTDQEATAMAGQASTLMSNFVAATAFAEPEILALGRDRLRQWQKEDVRLRLYEHYFDNLFRQQAHVRSAEVEEILGMARDPFATIEQTADLLTDADIVFKRAVGADGQAYPVAQSTITHLLHHADREVRRTAWESYADGYLAFKNTLASNLTASIKRDVFYARARRYRSSLEAALFENNIPPAVFHNLLDTYRKHLPTWHRYWRVRRQALGLSDLHPYDIWAPLATQQPEVSYTQAVEWIAAGMQPLGEAYVSALRQGCLQDRWVDVYPNRGKRQGAFSFGWRGTHPFIVMSFANDLASMSTLAHELGHSMHSYLTWRNQPMIYSDYSLFVAEVASNFNQAMVRAYLLEQFQEPQFQIAVIEEAMNNFHRYFFIMPALARFELEMHERVERGQGLTADAMSAYMADLFEEGYGGEMVVDRDRVGITWAQFSHLYTAYYVYQYATGISAAHALAAPILRGEPGAAERYLQFLSAGGSLYPIDALKLAGVDMESPEAVEQTFAVLSDYVDRLARLTGVE
ncbi:MAG: oligoendopeptidase F [Chloroflexota bacterium]|nr:MAG: oligoendopeptidase F [Chloroflexota bacterium]